MVYERIMPDMINTITEDDKLLTLLDKYSFTSFNNSTKISEIILKLAKNIENPELIVPVLGSQGTGKSTLINAILGINILPNDADETTCVPVEIRYGDKENAIVYFQSGKSTEIKLSCDALREFVDNNENQGNEKSVSHIVFKTPNKLLKNGLVIVDLPGVGSLTKNNQETTMRYIRQLCTAIFVIPTVPTIRRSEEIFIRGAWSSFSSAIFVQNRWDGETDEEVADSIAFNSTVLENIAKNTNIKFNGKICVVNAYMAILSKIHNNIDEFKKSNLNELITELENLGNNRVENEKIYFKNKVISFIDTAETNIKQLIKESQMNEEQLKAEHERIRKEFEKSTNEIKVIINDLVECVNTEKDKSNIFISELSKTAAENLRVDICKLIDCGIVDGEQLTDAFSDYQENYMLDAIEQHYDFMSQITYELSKKLEILAEKIQIERATSFEAQQFENGQAFKYEKGVQVGIDIIGDLGGVIAYSGIIGSVGGPVGAVIGLLVCAGIRIIAGILGKKAKNKITANRALQAKKAIKPFIEEFKDKIHSAMLSNTTSVLDSTLEVLNSYMNDRNDYYETMMLSKEQEINSEYKNEYNVSKLNEKLDYLENKKETLK